ncbi:hypothetical protein [Novosphingobium sp. AAP93]|uniref:hypothetical protein n=1 Tax=Novosphingobium sp. AAP93 TaxID=1523427 RepID=UPI0006B9BF7F|nr:hypothetical protein [Novosphingobium sp. AAP93]
MSTIGLSSLRSWENLLLEINPLQEAQHLAASVLDPATATADQCWTLIWDKPLFANTRVATGVQSVRKLEPYMAGAWRTWGTPNGAFSITHRGGYNKRSNFHVSGSAAPAVDALGIARHRLLAVQGGARLLRALAAEDPIHPFKSFASLDRPKTVTRIQELAGRGWGHITTLHLMTDFGLAVKPDLHLVRTVKAIGLAPHIRESNVPNIEDALTINNAVDDLGKKLFGDEYGPSKRRYLDKILMELSRQDLLGVITNKDIP